MIISLRKISFAGAFLALGLLAPAQARAAQASITIDATTGYVLEKFQPDKKRHVLVLEREKR